MAWHRAGTVVVTSGSTTVTGIGTGFAANTRVGDAFIGPDGRQYELQNVASDTVVSILPAYLGQTASGQPYAVMPVQGYQKLLADLVRDWTNQYGSKMASLGTTGNYDVLPVTKGGTGGADQASARAGLGLGTAATANITTSSTDSTAGRVMTVGDFGLGGKSAVTAASADTVAGGGTYRITDSTPGGPGFFGSLWHHPHDADAFVQMAISITDGVLKTRRRAGGVTAPWISQTPEFIANANGSAVKLSDGTMICWTVRKDSGPANNSIGAGLYSSSAVSFQWPVAFVGDAPVVSVTSEPYSVSFSWIVLNTGASLTGLPDARIISGGNGALSKITVSAIGRWK